MKKKKSSIDIFKSAMFDEGVRQILEAKRENQGPVPHGQYQKISTMLEEHQVSGVSRHTLYY